MSGVKDLLLKSANLAAQVDMLLVVGARNSSNSNRLREIGTDSGVPSYLIDDANSLDPAWLKDVRTVGVTAGAAAPAFPSLSPSHQARPSAAWAHFAERMTASWRSLPSS